MKRRKSLLLKVAALLCMLVGIFAFSGQVQAENIYVKDGFCYEKEFGKVYIRGYHGTDTTMNIPAEIDGCPVTEIRGVAYGWGQAIGSTYLDVEHIVMPDTVTKVSFYGGGMGRLKSVRFSSNLKKLPDRIFDSAESLQSLTNTKGIESIGTSAFSKTNLYNADFPNVTEVGSNVFNGCTNLVKANFPKLDTAEGWMFADCVNLESVTLSPKLKCIGAGAFAGAKSLTAFKFPATCTRVEQMSFMKSGLKSVLVPSTVTELGAGSFRECKNLERAVLRISGTLNAPFWACSNLTDVDLGTKITSIRGNAFTDCRSLRSITIPDSVTYIDYGYGYAFNGCESLVEVRGYRGTAAEEFANAKGIPFTALTPKITLSASSLKLYPVSGFNTSTLKVTREGTSASVKFKSSNTGIAAVSAKGVITAKKAGTVTITVTCGSLKKTCKVVAGKPAVTLTTPKSVVLKVGKKTAIKAKAVPAAQIKFSTKDKTILAVNASGKVYGKKKGVGYVKVYIDGAYKTVKVTVK